MGRIFKANCCSCDWEERFFCGQGWSDCGNNERYYKKVIHGEYGQSIKDYLSKNPTLSVDTSRAIYQCPGCLFITEEEAVDLISSFTFSPTDNDIVYQHKHMCPHCDKRMIKIAIKENETSMIRCPKCKSSARLNVVGCWD